MRAVLAHEGLMKRAVFRPPEIEFLDLELRDNKDIGVSLESITVLDIRSLTPRIRPFQPTSWRLKASLERLHHFCAFDRITFISPTAPSPP